MTRFSRSWTGPIAFCTSACDRRGETETDVVRPRPARRWARYYSGIDDATFEVSADFEIAGVPAGENLAPRFHSTNDDVFEWKLPIPLKHLPRDLLTVSVKDRHGNVTVIERTFSVGKSAESSR